MVGDAFRFFSLQLYFENNRTTTLTTLFQLENTLLYWKETSAVLYFIIYFLSWLQWHILSPILLHLHLWGLFSSLAYSQTSSWIPSEGLWRRVGRNERCYFLFLLLKIDLFHTIYIHYVLPSFYPPSSYPPSLVAGSTIFQSLLKRQAGIQEKTIKYSKIKEKQIHWKKDKTNK